jgi:hypothetical protein
MGLMPATAMAQTTPGPVGPYVVDVRGAMTGLPSAGEFYPTLTTSTNIPTRAFGLDAGASVYPRDLWKARLGIGTDLLLTRGKVGPPDVTGRLTAVVPQVSLNFGTADGWSHVSAGYGVGQLTTDVPDTTGATVETGRVGAFSVGGGARWFTSPHLAVGFDIRLLRLGASSAAATPAVSSLLLTVGLSLR